MQKTRLTIKKIEKLSSTDNILWDTDVPGLHVRVLKTGKYFYLYYRNQQGQQRKPSLGRYGAITLEQARQKARSWWQLIQAGGDPALDKQKARQRNALPTVEDLKQRWEEEHAPQLKTRRAMLGMWNGVILPRLGLKNVKDVCQTDIEGVLKTISGRYQYNRIRSLLLKAFNLAEEWGWREQLTNPCRHIKKKKEEPRRRYMSPAEITALGNILQVWDQKTEGCEPYFAALIRLLMFTGARRGEIMNARWEYVNWRRKVLELPDSKTGCKEIVLPDPAIAVLRRLSANQVNDWIIPGREKNRPLNNPSKLWRRLLRAADIQNLRIHDLRHTFASIAMSSADGTLTQVGALLGHAQAETTKRYAHFMIDAKRELANKISLQTVAWLSPTVNSDEEA